MSASRSLAVLERFPQHIGATDPGKTIGFVVDGLADPLDVVTRQIGEVRKAHRLADAPTRPDLLGLAALHALGLDALALVDHRLDVLGDVDPDDHTAVSALVGLTTESVDELAATGPHAVADSVSELRRHSGRRALDRSVVTGAIAALRIGNGTPSALLCAVAGYLGLEVDRILHTAERWWHLAVAKDVLRLGSTAALEPVDDVVGLEENPFRRADIAPAPKTHGQRFRILRGGLDDVDVTVRVIGISARTVRPMLVHVDAGVGLVFEGEVPDGQELRFTAAGQVTLGTSDVTGSAWSFTGAVFASAAAALPARDFVFGPLPDDDPAAHRSAAFAVTAPVADALDAVSGLPHGAPAVGPHRLPLGESYWASFVRVAHFGASLVEPAVPRTSAGRVDQAVFAGDPSDPCYHLGLEWEEREPFAVRVLLPRRLGHFDDDQGTKVAQPLAVLLDRHRAAGVEVRVEYADPRWTLGTGIVRDALVPIAAQAPSDEALGIVLAGTELWPDGTPQPHP